MEDIIKVIDLDSNTLLNLILEEVAFAYGVMQMVDEKKGLTWIEVCGYNGRKKDTESEQDYEDRIYTDAHSAVMSAIERIEEDEHYDFEGLDLDAKDGVAWYDEVREDAIRTACEWFTNGQKETEYGKD